MQLKELLENTSPLNVAGNLTAEVDNLVLDSREVQAGSLFFALRGETVDGHAFIDQAWVKGAVVVVAEQMPDRVPGGRTVVITPDSARAMGAMADIFYGRPSKGLNLIGVTGTNGKTTTVTLLHDLFTFLGYKCGLLSTVENRIGAVQLEATHTTPDAITTHRLLAEMVEAGCEYAFMEVSSHAVVQKRIAGLYFRGGVFTNISRDHLDYHRTFRAYIEAKQGFFNALPPDAFALVNIDDKHGEIMVERSRAKVHRYGLRNLKEYHLRVIANTLPGLQLEIAGREVHLQLIGRFNAYNILAVFAVADLLGQDTQEVLKGISALKATEGRFDYLYDPGLGITGIVDYAHTPDALEKVLSTIAGIRKPGARILTVVGCGGDRDRGKRPEMTAVCCRFSDWVITTSDNPRSEEPNAILDDMEKGLSDVQLGQLIRIEKRRHAIRAACRLARNGDIVLVAGKGHEKYQEIQGVKYPFDDKAVLNEELAWLRRAGKKG